MAASDESIGPSARKRCGPQDDKTVHVGTAAPGCPAVRSSAVIHTIPSPLPFRRASAARQEESAARSDINSFSRPEDTPLIAVTPPPGMRLDEHSLKSSPSKGCSAMNAGSIRSARSQSWPVTSARKTNRVHWYCWVLAALLVAAVIPAPAVGQTFTVLYQFRQGEISNPASSLILDPEGNLYGTTLYGGDLRCNTPFGCGTVYRVDATGKRTVLYSFTGKTDGGLPAGGLNRDDAGNLFGTTENGGDVNKNFQTGAGVVFQAECHWRRDSASQLRRGDGRRAARGRSDPR